MTLVLACLTETAVYLLSDRRLVSSGDVHQVVDDESNKTVVTEGRVAFAYTGLAMIGSRRTDDWLASVISDGPTRDMAQVCLRIRDRATEEFKKLRLPAKLKRHAFMGAGWFVSDAFDGFRPGIVAVDNAIEHSTRVWLDEPLAEFHTAVQLPRALPGGCVLDSVGINPSLDEKRAVVRLVRRCVKHRSSTLRTVEHGLITSLRWLSLRHPEVGPSLMSVCIPKKAVELADSTGQISVMSGPPTSQTPSFFYVSPTGSRTSFGPHLVGGGAVITGLKVEHLGSA
jgi:hypothetical protein